MPPRSRPLSSPSTLFLRPRKPSRRIYSNPSNPNPPTPPKTDITHSRFQKLNARLPSFLRTYTTPLLCAPVTHISSFLILHEITAILPLFGLVGAFHYGGWLPGWAFGGASEKGQVVGAFDEGMQQFGRWLRKKGWVEEGEVGVVAGDGAVATGERNGAKLVVEFAAAYAITKALLPVRIVASVWATPWFARSVLGPLGNGARRLFGRK